MADMESFMLFFLDELPDFLMSEPIIYLVGFGFCGIIITLIKRIVNL